MYGNAARDLGLRLAEVQGSQGLCLLVVATPAQPGCFAVPKSSQALQRVQHAAILRDAAVRDELFDFLSGVNRAVAPVGILVDLLGQDPASDNARGGIDKLVDDGGPEEQGGGLEGRPRW